MHKLKVGDVVRLNSGGPNMTVVGLNESGTAACHWFENGEVRMNAYQPDALTVVSGFDPQPDAVAK